MMKTCFTLAFTMLLASVVIVQSGCSGDSDAKSPDGKSPDGKVSSNKEKEVAPTEPDPNHGGWWCVEHAIPEEECSMCSQKYAAQCKEKGDWCEEHNRAKSQCFVCDPSKAEPYAKLYEAKYGKKPPAAIE